MPILDAPSFRSCTQTEVGRRQQVPYFSSCAQVGVACAHGCRKMGTTCGGDPCSLILKNEPQSLTPPKQPPSSVAMPLNTPPILLDGGGNHGGSLDWSQQASPPKVATPEDDFSDFIGRMNPPLAAAAKSAASDVTKPPQVARGGPPPRVVAQLLAVPERHSNKIGDERRSSMLLGGTEGQTTTTPRQPPVVSDGFKLAMAPLGQGPPQCEGGDDREEPEPEEAQQAISTLGARRECCKCLTVAIVVWGIVICSALTVLRLRSGYAEGDCDWVDDLDPPLPCDTCGEGTQVLPLGGEWEKSLSRYARAPIYFLGMTWCFLGIAIVCDQFMAAIEVITSKERLVWLKVTGEDVMHRFHLRVWNPTVANLTLMALGSSAPEILLSCLELAGNRFFVGELGPSTIVGSAAFNLLVITSVCISAVPAPDIRKIEMTDVFALTATFSLLSYFWLVIVLQLVSPDKVEPWEAIATFAQFPVLIVMAYVVDRGWCNRRRSAGSKPSAIAADPALSGEQQRPTKAKATRASRRADLMNGAVTGRKKFMAPESELVVGFRLPQYAVLECEPVCPVSIVLGRPPGCVVHVKYRTRDGSAKAGLRYRSTEGVLRFEANQTERIVEIPIIDNRECDPDECFSVLLDEADFSPDNGTLPNMTPLRIEAPITVVTIINDDEAGTLGFAAEEVMPCRDSSSVTLSVLRTKGNCGDITCQFETIDGTAKKGRDYLHSAGMLSFADRVEKRELQIKLLKVPAHPEERRFRVVLTNVTHGGKFDANTDGGVSSAISEIITAASPEARRSCWAWLGCNYCWPDWASIEEWAKQFPEAMYCGGSAEEQSQAGFLDWCMHSIALIWKMLFATVAPPALYDGWLCFLMALTMIGLITMIVGDMAKLLGCSLGMPDHVTAISLVALGTSLPDTFASHTAAVQDESADNSVGNITGSNSVNISLGLGLPWTIGAFYWRQVGKTDEWKERVYQKRSYEEGWGSSCQDGCLLVPAGSLSVSVAVFTGLALLCLALLCYRRWRCGGELGGPKSTQRRDSAILIVLWGVFVVVSCTTAFHNGK